MRGTKKRSIYVPAEMMSEIDHEMQRQERTLSWLMQQAWRIARPTIQSLPGIEDHLASRS